MKDKSCLSKNKGYSLFALSETRAQLYGVMTLLILFCHTFVRYDLIFRGMPIVFVPIEHFRRVAIAGVEMFLIMSGISLYFSFSAEGKIRSFYKKRAVKIIPVVLIVSFLWYAILGVDSVSAYFKSVFLITFFTEGKRYFWFFAFLIVCYFFYPFIHKLFEKHGVVGFIILVVAVTAGGLLFMKLAPDVYYKVEIAVTRCPSFLLGCWLGKYVKEKKCISVRWLAVAAIVLCICVGYSFINKSITSTEFYYMCLPVAASSLMLLSAFFSRFTIRSLNAVLVWMGGYSLEIYILYEKVRDVSATAIGLADETLVILYSFTFVVTVVLAIGLKAVCRELDKNLFSKKQ